MRAEARCLRVGVVCDYLEERWPSMDLVGDMLLRSLAEHHRDEVLPTAIRPAMKRRFSRLPLGGAARIAMNADRLIARLYDYPRALQGHAGEDLYHIVDHSYAHLAHALPDGRTVVTCHDLDTFRSVLTPEREPRGPAFRAMTRRILSGLQRAAFVTCDSVATRDEIVAHRLLPAERLRVIPLGVSPVMSPAPNTIADATATALLGAPGVHIDILHVGSTIPRKRIDTLLRITAAVRAELPTARLIRCGGPFTGAQAELARELGLGAQAILELPFLTPAELAAVYRRSAVVVQPSAAEGFGLPVVEAMACGAPVVASDLPVLREVGGEAARYCPVDDIRAWRDTLLALLHERQHHGPVFALRREAILQQAAKFSWDRFAAEVVDVYRRVASANPTRLAQPT